MNRILNIVSKDLLQLVRDWQTFLFLLAMPILFTLMFGLAFGGAYDSGSDPRLPVALIDEDGSSLASAFTGMLTESNVLRIADDDPSTRAELEEQVADNDLAALIVIPAGYSGNAETGSLLPVEVVTSPDGGATTTVEGEVMALAGRLANAVNTAQIVSSASGSLPFDQVLDQSVAAWQQPPIDIQSTGKVVEQQTGVVMSMSHSSPAMMLQFGMAGLLTAAQVMVAERKTRSLQRMLTTATSRLEILIGHYLSIYILILIEFILLVGFGTLFLKVDYFRIPGATLLVMLGSALWIAALGLLIGVLAKSDEQAVIFSLMPMFILSALGGAWTPLEVTSAGFQAVGHFSPVAWSIDGFKNIIARGLGFESILVPFLFMLGYAVLFFAIAAWRFYAAQEK